MKERKIKAIAGIFVVLILFVIITYISNKYLISLESSLSKNYLSMVIYLLLVTLEIVLAPLTLIPIIPLASTLWGGFAAFLLTLAGWTLGSMVIFIISRKIGLPLIEKLTSKKELNKVRTFMPHRHLFLGVIVVRIFLPFDILSYGISLFTNIRFKDYTLGTLIGYAPIVFIFAYFGGFSNLTQIILGILGIVLIFLLILFKKQLRKLFVRVFG